MMPRSLYGRLILGALIWTVGLVLAIAAVGTFLISHQFASQLFVHNSMLVVSGAVLVTAGVSVMRRGLSPFGVLRERLVAIREGRTTRLEGDYPSEVVPLVEDLNHLLEERERRVTRAVARAGDLAHGLKTPLAIIAQDVDRATAAGQHELAGSLRKQVERMRRQIESHLSQARAAASGTTFGVRTGLVDCVGGLVRTMERLHADRGLTFTTDIPEAAVVRVPLEDLEEILGNLLDNACKWAAREVRLSASSGDAFVIVHVDDDGAGLEAEMRDRVLQRGVRADEGAPGSGLGLAIVRDLVDTYGGTFRLDRSPLGGLRARLTLPVPPAFAGGH
jgi:signal transduction histidine kinase